MWVKLFFLFKQKTAYEMRISDWSSDVCSSDLGVDVTLAHPHMNVLASGHPPHVRTQEHVRQEQDLLPGGNRLDDLDRVPRRAAVIAFRLYLGGRERKSAV